MKKCSKCGEVKHSSQFNKNAGHSDGLSYYCKACTKQYDAERHLKNPIRRKAQRFSLTDKEYLELIEGSGGRCDLCGNIITQERSAHIDHDHKCCPTKARSCGKCIRGVLCSTCNTGLGCFKDNEDLLMKAIEYLRKK